MFESEVLIKAGQAGWGVHEFPSAPGMRQDAPVITAL